MAGTIKGITIEFRGDTSSLDKALKKIRSESKGIDNELKQVNSLLRFNPKNTELLAQKQTLLKQKIDATNGQLKELKATQKQLDAQGVDKNSEAYRRVQREIIATESKLTHFKGELQKVAAMNSRIGQLGTSFKEIGGKATALGNSMRGLSIAAAGVVASLGAMTYKAARTADDINTLSKQYGVGTKDLQKWSAAADLVDVDLTSMTKSQVKLKRNMETAKKGTGDAANAFKALGVNVTGGNGELRDSNAVFNETIAALGKMENETQRDAYALQIFGRSAAQLNPLIEDNGKTYAMVSKIFADNNLEFLSQEELDRANAFKDQIDIMKAVFNQAVQTIGSKLAGFLLPAITKVQEAFTSIAGKIAGLSPAFFTVVGGIGAVVAAVAPALLIFGHMATAIGLSLEKLSLLIQKFPILGKAMGFLKANPIFLIIAALVALGLIINKTGLSADELSDKISGFVTKVVDAIPQVVETITKMAGTIVGALVTALPAVLQGLTTLIMALVKALPTVIPVLIQGVVTIAKLLVSQLGVILPMLIQAVTGIITQLAAQMPTLIPVLLNAAITLFGALVRAIPIVMKSLLVAMPKVWKAILTTVKTFGTTLWNTVKNIASGVVQQFGFTGLLGKVKNVFNNVKNAITNPIKTARDTVKKLIEKIKGLFPLSVGKIFSNIKLPKIEATGGKPPYGILGKGKAPKFSIKWHAQGGIFRRPTLLQGADGSVHGVGDAGAEAILPLSTLNTMLNGVADNIVNGVVSAQSMGTVGEAIQVNLYAFPNGQKLDEFVVDAYNRGSRRLGK